MFWIVAVSVLTLYNLTPSLNGFDSAFYIIAGERLWNGEIDCLRTPVYPLICHTFQLLFGDYGINTAMTIFQSIVYLFSLISLIQIAERCIHNKIVRHAILLFYVCCIAPGWCNELLTESLSISGMTVLANLVLRFVDNPKTKTNILIHLTLILLVFLRPTFILFFAILPVLWIILFWQSENKKVVGTALGFTIACVLCFAGYCKIYQKQYGHFGATATFVFNKIYDAKRGDYWDTDAVKSTKNLYWINKVAESYDGSYSNTYRIITCNPQSLPHINEACENMINAHKSEYLNYRIKLFIESFDKRLLAAVNTQTPLSAALFLTSLFLSFPVSLFYLLTFSSAAYVIIELIRRKSINIAHFFIVATILAQTVGIVLTTSDAFERVLLPVYPLLLILLGITIEKGYIFLIEHNLSK